MSLETQIETLNQWCNESRILLWNVEDGIDTRVISYYNQDQHGGIGRVVVSLRTVLQEFIESMQWFVYGYSSSFNYVYWYNIHRGLFTQESEITWKTICEAWAKNDFEGRAVTIAFIDRMRQLIWDEPFFVAWAAKPEEQF